MKVCRPLIVDEVSGAGVGAADSRMNAAKFSTSGKKSDAGLAAWRIAARQLERILGRRIELAARRVVTLVWETGVDDALLGVVGLPREV
jgi:hypothetical protein